MSSGSFQSLGTGEKGRLSSNSLSSLWPSLNQKRYTHRQEPLGGQSRIFTVTVLKSILKTKTIFLKAAYLQTSPCQTAESIFGMNMITFYTDYSSLLEEYTSLILRDRESLLFYLFSVIYSYKRGNYELEECSQGSICYVKRF